MVMHFDRLNRLEPPQGSYSSEDDPDAGVTDTKVFASIIYAKFNPKRSIKFTAGAGDRTVMSFPQAVVDELEAALGGLDVRVEEKPAHFSHDMQPGYEFVPHVIMLCFPTVGLGAQINMYADGIVNARREHLANPLYRQVLGISIGKLFQEGKTQ